MDYRRDFVFLDQAVGYQTESRAISVCVTLHIFSYYSSLGRFRLRDGRSIRTVSALLMQLVQTSAHDVRVDIDSLRAARQQELLLRRQDAGAGDGQEPFLDEKDMEVISDRKKETQSH